MKTRFFASTIFALALSSCAQIGETAEAEKEDENQEEATEAGSVIPPPPIKEESQQLISQVQLPPSEEKLPSLNSTDDLANSNTRSGRYEIRDALKDLPSNRDIDTPLQPATPVGLNSSKEEQSGGAKPLEPLVISP